MNEAVVTYAGQEAIRVILYIAGPMLIAAMVIGLLISILQAITQINEATLTFIPKMVAIVLVLVVLAPWMMEVLEDYTIDVIGKAGEWVR